MSALDKRKPLSNRYSRNLLHGLYYYAKFLFVINCRYDQDHQKMRHVKRTGKCATRTLRFILMLTYMGAYNDILNQYQASTDATDGSFLGFFIVLQMFSVMIFAIFAFIVQIRGETAIVEIINKFMQLFRRVAERSRIHVYTMLNQKFLIILLLKFLITFLGYLNEVPTLLHFDTFFEYGILAIIPACVGVYLWIGSMFVLDVCVLGLLIIALMYEEMGEFLKRLLQRMSKLEATDEMIAAAAAAASGDIGNCENSEMKFKTVGNRRGLSTHRRMKILCECADIISDCDVIYSELYRLTKCFQRLFQWQIFYYIYYNFMVILLTFHNCIWLYLHSDYIDKLGLLMVCVKIANLALLIMCADFVVQRAHMPQLLCLDVVCSDMDDRWCMSVETFLSRRQTERLEITVLGFFQLNNEFILLILSAIISYLFIIIQFGLSDQMTT